MTSRILEDDENVHIIYELEKFTYYYFFNAKQSMRPM